MNAVWLIPLTNIHLYSKALKLSFQITFTTFDSSQRFFVLQISYNMFKLTLYCIVPDFNFGLINASFLTLFLPQKDDHCTSI